jgi:ribosome-binding factor A
MRTSVQTIKQHQKESLLLKEISSLFWEITLENPALRELSINRVELAPDRGTCYVYFYTAGGKQVFTGLLEQLKLFKPSMRKAIAHKLQFRYTPDLMFRFDEQFEKQANIEKLLDQVKTEIK